MPDWGKLTGLLETQALGRELYCLDAVDSTNEYLKKRAETLSHGCTVLADVQEQGRGSPGKSWLSRKGESVLMSVLLKPEDQLMAPVITLACGLAVTKALNSLCGGGFKIKWPNDIVSQGQKVCGVLCESKFAETGSFIVCGIGINLTQDSLFFDESGLPYGASVRMLTGAAPSCEETAAAVLGELENIYTQCRRQGTGACLEEYRSLCVTLGRPVRVQYEGKTVEGTGAGINPDGSLLVDIQGGSLTIRSGEASVRGIMGYV